MSKKILAIALIASMLLSVFVGMVQADTEVSTLDALNEAITAGGTITLAADIEGQVTIPEGVNVTLDLAGFELKSTTSDTISNHGTLVIKGNGKITSTANNKGAIVNYPDGSVTIENGTIYAETWYSIKNMGTMTILDGNITKGTNGASVIANGWYGNAGTDRNTTGVADTAKLTIEGGTFLGDGKSSTVVKNDDYGILVINGGELTSTTEITDINAGPVILNWHDATINGGTFTSTNGAVLANGYLDDNADKGEMVVKGGTFISGTNAEILAYGIGATNEKGSLSIEGGNFAGKLQGETPYVAVVKGGNFSESVPEAKLDESLVIELKKAGDVDYPYSYYASEEEALEVAEVGDEINGEVVEAPKEYTLIFKDGYTENDEGIEVKVKDGDDIVAPELTREGYNFKAWDPELPVKFEVKTNEDESEIEVYVYTAQWTKKSSGGSGSGSSSNDNPGQDEPTEPEWENPYKDIKEDKWYFESVKKATESKLFNGVKEDEFMPEEKLTRGMAITVLYRLSGARELERAKFDDVSEDAYYSKAIAWAAKNKIVLGVGDNKFAPDEEITRQDLATMIYRYVQMLEKGYKEGEVEEVSYADKAEISNYAYDAISWCTKNNILEGRDNNKIDAKGTATRAESAKIFVQLSELLKENE